MATHVKRDLGFRTIIVFWLDTLNQSYRAFTSSIATRRTQQAVDHQLEQLLVAVLSVLYTCTDNPSGA
jgi:hypothetical protein